MKLELELIKLTKITNLELKEEYETELNKVATEIKEINEINMQINSMIQNQSENINTSVKECNTTLTNMKNSNEQLEKALEYKNSALYKKGILLTLCASVVSIPLAITLGTKIAIGAGLSSAFFIGNYV